MQLTPNQQPADILSARPHTLTRRHFTALLAAAAPVLRGQEATPLFNGRDLTGWAVREGPESAFYVADGAIVGSPNSAYPTWLGTNREYENFDLSAEVFLKGWIDGGLYLHAPEHGRPSTCGLKVNLFHAQDKEPRNNSMGAISLVQPPKRADLHKPDWNTVRVLSDWPVLRVWVNGEIVQDLKLDSHPELSRRLRRGYIGISSLSYPLRVRNIQLKELPAKEKWTTLFNGSADMEKWYISDSNQRNPARFDAYGNVLRGDGLGNFTTKEQYKDFDLRLYVRGSWQHNGGVLFRSDGKGPRSPKHYEIQLHDVPEAHYPTGSLYHHKRAVYPNIQPEKWFLMQLLVQGPRCQVRIDGDTILEYNDLNELDAGHIELQAHQAGRWVEFKQVKIKSL